VRGISGFGFHSILHTSRLLELSTDLPIAIEVVDSPDRIESLVPIRDEMVTEGVVTLEKVRVLKYAAGPRQK
jgi:PII-like signaling protein